MFSSVISLGFYCGVASSISKHGFRSFSGPFDWENSEYEGVLHFIDDDFSDFLSPENLETDNLNNKIFFDKKYNIRFPHDIHTSLAEDLPSIQTKYKRRIERFINEEHSGACFIRAINDPAEIDFIAENQDSRVYIQVAETLRGAETLKRELASLAAVSDNHEKMIITSDHSFIKSENGIKLVNIIDFLLE